MEFKNPLIVVTDMERLKAFYKKVLGASVVLDFGANVTLTGGVCLQTSESWRGFIGREDITFSGMDAELYFEENDFDAFAARLETCGVRYLHPPIEHPWGQRVVRFFDPDGHVIEVGENIKTVCRRFAASGLTVEETAKRMDVPVSYVEECLR